jgi:hypothetical protein
MTARWPRKYSGIHGQEMAQLDDPRTSRTVKLYRLIGDLIQVGLDEARLNAVADLIVEMTEESTERSELDQHGDEVNNEALIASSTLSQPMPTP